MLINYSSFAGVAGLTLNGNASFNSGTLQLTPDAQNQRGSAFWTTPIALNSDTSFSTNFEFQITGRQGTNGADGIAFLLQNNSQGARALGNTGSNLGFGAVGKSLAIKFDTRQNSGELSNNYVGINLNGSAVGAVQAVNAPIDLNSGQVIKVWIDYDGTTDQLSVFLAGSDAEKPTTALLTRTIDLAGLLGNQMYAGFTAATSGNTNIHRINEWQFTTPTTPDTTPAPLTGYATSFNYIDFSTGQGSIQTNGSASLYDRVIRLTSDQQAQAGSAFAVSPIEIYGDTSFNTNFKLQFSGVRGTNGGDGITFVLHNNSSGLSALGGVGGDLGYKGITDSLAIKFDTFQGTGELSNNYVAVITDGNATKTYDWVNENRVAFLSQARSPFDLNGRATILNVWVDYNGVTDMLSVYLSNTANKPTTALINSKIRLSNVVGSQAYVGFTGSTGGATSIQDVLSWEFSTSTPERPAVQPDVPRILALGDSITQGVTSKTVDRYRNLIPGGYRRVLWNKLTEAGISVDFVGSETDSNPNWQWLNGGDKDHQGMGGWTIEKISANIENYLKREKPDIITLTIGTNNIVKDASGVVMLAKLSALLDQITAIAPDVKILVASIPPAYSDIDRTATPELRQKQMQAIADYNNGMPSLIESKQEEGKNIYFVDMRSLTLADLAPRNDDNGLHPSMAGYDKIGTLWYNALLDSEIGGLSNSNALSLV